MIISVMLSLMTLCFLYPWVFFLFSFLPCPGISFLALASMIFTALAFSLLSRLICRKRISSYALFFTGWAVFVFYFLNACFTLPPFSSLPSGIFYFLVPERTGEGLLTAVFVYVLSFIIWFTAAESAEIPVTVKKIDSHFDRGLAFLLVLLLVRILVASRVPDYSPEDYSLTNILVYYLVLSLFTLALARHGRDRQTFFFSFKKGSAALLFSVSVIGAVSFTLNFFHGGLESAAETGSGIIENTAPHIETSLVVLINFFLDYRYRNSLLENLGRGETASQALLENGSAVFSRVFLYAVMLLLTLLFALAVITALVMIIKKIISFLAEEKNQKNKHISISDLLSAAVMFLKNLFSAFRLLRRNKHRSTASRYYHLLLTRGRLSGISCRKSETPSEYARRLSDKFPSMESGINLIISIHNRLVYGYIEPEKGELKTAGRVIKKIYNPLAVYRSRKK